MKGMEGKMSSSSWYSGSWRSENSSLKWILFLDLCNIVLLQVWDSWVYVLHIAQPPTVACKIEA